MLKFTVPVFDNGKSYYLFGSTCDFDIWLLDFDGEGIESFLLPLDLMLVIIYGSLLVGVTSFEYWDYFSTSEKLH